MKSSLDYLNELRNKHFEVSSQENDGLAKDVMQNAKIVAIARKYYIAVMFWKHPKVVECSSQSCDGDSGYVVAIYTRQGEGHCVGAQHTYRGLLAKRAWQRRGVWTCMGLQESNTAKR
ncbi:hypothetical protein GOP47_0003129 [Adiantum capillus-veneris]|uniref:Uncharacterized protein n=1 Tax=Adiantum capillus-veneris TaxID=13818 RepID=A0A9D4VBE2_ADICA|nr:hypothetical protein GOP47_0003129 [Adiantum capillus-veneris]